MNERNEPRYFKDLRRGLVYQDHVAGWFMGIGMPLTFWSAPKSQQEFGESRQGVEIKLDERFRDTGNLFIEYRERSNTESPWHDAGVMAGDSIWALAIGDYQSLYVFSMRFLRCLMEKKDYRRIKTDTSEGFLMPLADAEKYAMFFLPPPLAVPFSQRRPSLPPPAPPG